jgi:signal transduction histidine kinase/ActR/RegA family two-component response regulator
MLGVKDDPVVERATGAMAMPSDPSSCNPDALRSRVFALEREVARQQREAAAMAAAARLAGESLAVEDLAERVAQSLVQLFGAASATIRRLEPDGALVVLASARGSKPPAFSRGHTLPAGVGPAAQAVARGHAVWIPDVLTDPEVRLTPELRLFYEATDHRATLTVPLKARGDVVGAVTIVYPVGRILREDEVRLAEAFGDQVALALENARLFAETRGRLAESETLLTVAGVLAQALPIQEAMRRVAREVARSFQADMVGVYFLDATRKALVPMAGYHVPKHLVSAFVATPLPVELLRESFTDRRPVWTADFQSDPRFDFPFMTAVHPGTVLFAPTLVRGEAVGGIFLVWWRPGRTVDAAEIRLVEGVASQVGLAVENADLARQTAEKLDEMERLLSISRALSSTIELGPLLRTLLRQVTRTTGGDSAGVWLVDAVTGELEPFAGYHVPPDVLERVRRFRFDPSRSPLYADAIARRAVVAAGDGALPDGLATLAPHRAQLFAPIIASERLVGALIVVWWEHALTCGERELGLVSAMASQAGIALDNARLFEDDRRKLAELSTLYELSRTVAGQLETAQLVEAVHREVARVFDVRNLAIFLYHPGRRELELALRAWDGTRERDLPRRRPLGIGLASAVVTRRAPLRTSDYAAACAREGVTPVAESLSLPHWLGAPMIVGDEVLGALTIGAATRPFTEADERLLTNIASLTALALRSARLYEERAAAYRELTLAQDHMVRSEKLRALGEMAAGVAHDFNNLLAVIVGRAELLLRHAPDPELARGLETIRQAGLDGAQTVRRIQEFTRTRRTRPFRQVDLLDLVREVVEMTRPRWKDEAQSRGVSYEVAIEGGPLPWVAGRPEELREVFTNLLTNALEAMPGGGRLVFGLGVEKDTVVVTARDTGIGMPPDIARRVFEPFFTTKGPQGSGLGLAVVWGIVTRHGGTVEVDSRPGDGALFTMRLPVARAVPEPPSRSTPARPARAARVLVIDDEVGVREVLRDLLARDGYAVIAAPDGRSGLAVSEKEPVDLVLSDLSMPGMSGWEVAEACHVRFPRVPVGLITGWGDRLDPAELARHGVRFVVAKPFEAADVLHRVGEALAAAGRA